MSYTRLTAKASLNDGSSPNSDMTDVVAKYLVNNNSTTSAANSSPRGYGGSLTPGGSSRIPQRLQTDPIADHRQFDRQAKNVTSSIASIRADDAIAQAVRTHQPPFESPLMRRSLGSPDRDRLVSVARIKAETPRLFGPDPVQVVEENEELKRELAFKSKEMEGYEQSYSETVDVFRTHAQHEKNENMNLYSSVQKLRAQLHVVEESKNELEVDRLRALSRQEEQCNRKILHMRKSMLMTEQSLGSLRSENDSLAVRATEAELAKEENESLRRQLGQLNQNLTVLAQQNEALQRELRRKEQETTADLDVYIKQLDMVQAQAALTKKENERLTLHMRSQEKMALEIDQLKNQNEELQVSINNLDLEASEQQERNQQLLQDKDEECAREVVNFRRQIIQLEKQVESLTLQNTVLVDKHRPQKITEEINNLSERVRRLTEENARHEQQNEALQRAFQRKEEEMLKARVDATRAEEEIRSKMTAAVNDHRSAAMGLERSQNEASFLKRQLEDLTHEKHTFEMETQEKLRALQAQPRFFCFDI